MSIPLRREIVPETRFRRLPDWGPPLQTDAGAAYVVGLDAARKTLGWDRLWRNARHDHRHLDIVHGTIPPFEHHFLILEDREHRVRAIQPVFVCAQNILDGLPGRIAATLRRLTPHLTEFRALMAGSPVGEGGFGADPADWTWAAGALGQALPPAAHRLGASIIVVKEFPAALRCRMHDLEALGYARVPSMPYVTLDVDCRNFDDHLQRSLSSSTRKDLRRKFRDANKLPPLTMEVTNDISDRIDELYPLYLEVYERASLRFERLTPEYFARLGREMPDRARFFVWSQSGRPVAFNACTLHEGSLWADYLGLRYEVALDLHLYFIVMRDLLDWCCREGIGRFCGTSLNYEPKLRLGMRLLPLDLYVRHINPLANGVLRRFAPWLTPVRHDEHLKKFPNAEEL